MYAKKKKSKCLYINKYTNAYENKNLGYSEEKIYKKAVDDCSVKKDKEACLYIYNNFVVNGNYKVEKNIFNLITILTHLGIIIQSDKDKKYKEIDYLISLDSYKNALDEINSAKARVDNNGKSMSFFILFNLLL